MKEVFLAELGIVNALGSTREAVLGGLLDGRCDGMVRHGPLMSGRSTFIGRVNSELPAVPPHLAQFDCRNNRLMLLALEQITTALRDVIAHTGPERVAVVLGTSTSGIGAGEEALAVRGRAGRFPPGFHYRQQEIGTLAEFTARYLQVEGPRYTISTACSSSAKAMLSARRLLSAGICDAVVTGGCDSLCRLTLEGFDSLEAVSAGICNPFSRYRAGINLGEGAAVFLMTRQPARIALLGGGEASDAYHVSAPDPEGRGAAAAMRQALNDAGLAAADIGYLNLHGTGTIQNDAMESHVVSKVFGPGVPCSSTKSQIGHTLGAAGAQETGLCWLLLSESNMDRRLPQHQWDGESDPSLPPIGLTTADSVFGRSTMMSNSFAFGGSNVSIIIGSRH